MATITIFTAGESRGNPGPSAIGFQILDESGKVLEEVSETIGNATNNFAEYQAVMRSLQVAKEHFGDKTSELLFELKLANELVKKQLNNEFEIKEPGLVPYFIEIHNMRVSSFPNLKLTHLPKEQNQEANRLMNEALDRK
ncbi:MAG: ribonuclease putative phosphoglycerate mutase [Candidatus Parcubacteria bacterium]|jgi:ribonuclease HI